jgi:hypothetical protein
MGTRGRLSRRALFHRAFEAAALAFAARVIPWEIDAVEFVRLGPWPLVIMNLMDEEGVDYIAFHSKPWGTTYGTSV